MNHTIVAGVIALEIAVALVSGARAEEAPPDTLAHVVQFPEVIVSTTRPGDRAPIARSVLVRDELLRRNWGQDTPMALATLPGAYAYSDAGNGIGYSYLSIRGFPQRRISVLVNGVPLNDPESHEVYWIDHPDLLASTAEVQLQRGVGSSLYGAASVGGSVNLETAPFSDTPRTNASIAYGSYETKRLMLEMNSGRLAGGWNLYGRYSRIESFGYRDDSWSKLWSYAFSGRKIAGPHSFRVNAYGGPEQTHLAYLGVPSSYLEGKLTGDADQDRRINPITYPNERDHFFEPHYELIHSWSPGARLALTHTLFYFDGSGYYDEHRLGANLSDYRLASWATADSTIVSRGYYRDLDHDGVLDRDAQGRAIVDRFDVVRRRTVVNRHYGWVPRLRLEHARGTITFGGELRAHDGRHYGEVVTGDGITPGTGPDHTYYDYHPRTLSAGLFAREEWRAGDRLLLTGDLAWRHQRYSIRDDHFDHIGFDQSYDFAVPRLGVTFTPRPTLSAFASWSQSSREPALRDLYDGEGPGSVPLFAQVDVAKSIYRNPLIRPEHVNDFELGGSWRASAVSLTANLFRMTFRDELVYAGQFNTDLGYSILGNAARSVHQGLELSAKATRGLTDAVGLVLDANTTLSDNHFLKYQEAYGTAPSDLVHYDGKAIGFFPAVMANLSARMTWRGASLGVAAQHIGRIFLDNTEDDARAIDPHTTLDLIGGYRVATSGGSHVALQLRVFNAADARYSTGGYMDSDINGDYVPHFIPAATRNVLGEVRVEF